MNSPAYDQYKAHLGKLADYQYISALLSWDQEVMMPPGGSEFRARHLSTLSEHIHQLITDERLNGLVDEALSKPEMLSDTAKRNLEISKRNITRAAALPTRLVKELTEATSRGYEKWAEAKAKKDFSVFAPALEKIISLQKEKINCLPKEANPYDTLLDEYDEGLTTTYLNKIFSEIKPFIINTLDKIKGAPFPSPKLNSFTWNDDAQVKTCKEMATLLSYDTQNGRLDQSAHPFSITIAPHDSRITTRTSDGIAGSLWGTIHEIGHAFYELGLPVDQYGLPCGEAASLSIHESQSRLWENCVGKSLPFVKSIFPLLTKNFPELKDASDAEAFYKWLNGVSPNLIRINSDELTYHLHIILRFEIEQEIFNNNIPVSDLPEIWNSKVEQYLGLKVPNDAEGVLQDIHWSHGSFGYFPTYSLGSFYASQFSHALQKDLGPLEELIAKKAFGEIRAWLDRKIYRHGKFFRTDDLCAHATGESLNTEYYKEDMEAKLKLVYNW